MKILIAIISLFLNSQAVELLVEARDRALSGEEVAGRAQRGMVIVAKPDGWKWGSKERLPRCVIIKLPGVTVEQVAKYLRQQFVDSGGELVTVRYRVWRIRWEDLPLAARNKLANDGEITIGPSGDYTWVQFRQYIRNLETGLDETGNP